MQFLISFFYCVFFAICTTPIWQLLNNITWERKGNLQLKAKREVVFFPMFLIAVMGISGYILSIYFEKIQFSDCKVCPRNLIPLGLISGMCSMVWGYMVVMRKKRKLLIWQERNREMGRNIDIKPKPIVISNVYLSKNTEKAEREALGKEKEEEEFKAKFAKKKMGKHVTAWEKKFKSKADSLIEEREQKAEQKKQQRKEDRKEQARIRKKMLADKVKKKKEMEKKKS